MLPQLNIGKKEMIRKKERSRQDRIGGKREKTIVPARPEFQPKFLLGGEGAPGESDQSET